MKPIFFAALAIIIFYANASQAGMGVSLKNCLLASNEGVSVSEKKDNSAKWREILRKNLDAKITSSANSVAARVFTVNGKEKAFEVRMITVTYKNTKTAEAKAEDLAKTDGYFHKMKTLTQFTYGQFDNKIVIAYTEKTDDKAAAECLKIIPALTAGGIKE